MASRRALRVIWARDLEVMEGLWAVREGEGDGGI